ncbi:apolipoprotein C-II-like [Hemicordylus capensis]|uniref:apolipoprotein C-II-like n=1 Tax=Hemicordylus capensis TaxID=884348 RepID=UPI0023021D4D|nr:apolipoprotein C-II-like [Hemicordylus capensis]XP_053122690.1 apolipoprotein C-II-like [Hemicordylus capensis]
MDLKVVLASILLLLFCSEVASYSLQKREAPPKEPLTQLGETISGYWDQFSTNAQDWLGKITTPEFSEQVRNIYKKSTMVVGTYTNILSDQVYHWWHGEN